MSLPLLTIQMDFVQSSLLLALLGGIKADSSCPSYQDLHSFVNDTEIIDSNGLKFNKCLAPNLQRQTISWSLNDTCGRQVAADDCKCSNMYPCNGFTMDVPISQCSLLQTTNYFAGCSQVSDVYTYYAPFENSSLTLPETVGENIIIQPEFDGYTILLLGALCLGRITTYTVQAVDSTSHSRIGTYDWNCCDGITPLTIKIDQLKPATNYNFTIFVTANCGEHDLTNSITPKGDIPPTLAQPRIPSSSAELINVTSNSASIAWAIQPKDCDFVLGTLIFMAKDDLNVLHTKQLNSTQCRERNQITLEVKHMLPYREFNVTTVVCYSNNKCEDEVIFRNRTLSSVANLLDNNQISVKVSYDSIRLTWLYDTRNCTGPTTFTVLVMSEDHAYLMPAGSESFPDCENDRNVSLEIDGLLHGFDYKLAVTAEVKGVQEAIIVANLTAKTDEANPRFPSSVIFKGATSNSALFSWDFNIQSDCFAQTITYTGHVVETESNLYSSDSDSTISQCSLVPRTQVYLNLTKLHPYRSYKPLHLQSCIYYSYCLEHQYQVEFKTLSGPAENDMSEYKFWGDYSAFSINWQFYKDDCFGPTFFNITYTSPLGEIRVHLHNSSDYPNCPLYNQPSYEEVQISNLTANSNYVFCIAPYTDKGTKVLVKPIAVYISTATKTSSNSTVLQIVGGLILFFTVVMSTIDYS